MFARSKTHASINKMESETKQWDVQDWERIYKSSTDPDTIADNKRRNDAERRKVEKKKDTGL